MAATMAQPIPKDSTGFYLLSKYYARYQMIRDLDVILSPAVAVFRMEVPAAITVTALQGMQ